MKKFGAFLGRHKFAVFMSLVFVGGPILLVMPPLVFLMVIIWGWALLDECKRMK